MPIGIDDAIALFVETLRAAPSLLPGYDFSARKASEGCDVLVTDVLRIWWFREHGHENPMRDPGELDYAPFHDAAWELARRGILRPGPAFPGLRNVMGGPTQQKRTAFRLQRWAANGYRITIKRLFFLSIPAVSLGYSTPTGIVLAPRLHSGSQRPMGAIAQ